MKNEEINHFHKNQVNRGWNAMHELLERDMPQQKRKKRIAFWFWIGGSQAAILALAFSGWYMFLKSNSTLQNIAKSQNIIEQSIITKEKSSNFSARSSITSSIEAYPYAMSESLLSLIKSIQFYGFNSIESKGKQEKSEISNLVESKLIQNTEQEHIEHSSSLTQILPVKNLQLLSINIPELNAIPGNYETKHLESIKKTRRTFGLTTGIVSENIPNMTGFLGGIAFDWRINSKFGVRSSVNYQYSRLKTNIGEAPVLAVNGNTFAHYTGDTSLLSKNNSTDHSEKISQEVFITIYQQHKIDIPIMIYWQALKRTRVYGGLSVGRIIKAKSGDYALTKSDVYDLQHSSSTQERGTDNLIQRYLPKWNMDYQIGLGYQCSKKFDVNLYVKNGINKRKTANYSQNNYRSYYSNPTLKSISTKHPLPLLQLTATVKF